MIEKIELTVKFFIYAVIALVVKVVCKLPATKHGILIIKTDGIGDYILFRNFIPYYAAYYAPKEITFLCSSAVVDTYKLLEYSIITNFVALDIHKYERNLAYIYKVLVNIRRQGFETVIHPTYSRKPNIDIIVSVASANKSIAFDGDLSNSTPLLNGITATFYSTIIKAEVGYKFEFNRSKEFTSAVINETIALIKPTLKIINSLTRPITKPYVVLFPGASDKVKIWNVDNFIAVAKYISSTYKHLIAICGSAADEVAAAHIETALTGTEIINLCNKTNLMQTIVYIKDAKLLVSNDTMAIHIAAAIGTPFVCVANGRHFGRYTPYPDSMAVNGTFIFPDPIFYMTNQYKALADVNKYNTKYSIDDIKTPQVISALDKYLKEPANPAN